MDLNSLKILSWNINGIRSTKTSLKPFLDSLNADIICFQETKITREMVTENIAIIDGYNSYFSFSRKRSGYSGVATFVKNHVTPISAEEGLSGILNKEKHFDVVCCDEFTVEELQSLDGEGRAVITVHLIRLKDKSMDDKLAVINVYCPRFDPNKPERMNYKLKFYHLLQKRASSFVQDGINVVIVGDINTAHKPIDHCDPCEEFSANPGRKWLDQFLHTEPDEEFSMTGKLSAHTTGNKFVDTFRYFHPLQEKAFTCWSVVTRARETNYGTRIDYIFGNEDLVKNYFSDSVILPEIEGSDHCPVMAKINCVMSAASKCPMFCSKYWPEFYGKQQKLHGFLKHSKSTDKNKSDDLKPTASVKRSSSQDTLPSSKSLKTSQSQKSIESYFLNGKSNNDSKKISEVLNKEEKIIENQVSNQPSSQDSQTSQVSVNQWKLLLKGPSSPPLCKGHKEVCVLRTVKKPGQNFRKQFYLCARPEGHSSNPEARCNFFQWLK